MPKSGRGNKKQSRSAVARVLVPVVTVLSLLTGLGQIAAEASRPALFVFSVLLELCAVAALVVAGAQWPRYVWLCRAAVVLCLPAVIYTGYSLFNAPSGETAAAPSSSVPAPSTSSSSGTPTTTTIDLAGMKYLSDMSIKQGKGADSVSTAGRTISTRGGKFEDSRAQDSSCTTDQWMEFDLDGEFTRLYGKVGFSEVNSDGVDELHYGIYLDGEEIGHGFVTRDDEIESIDVPVTGGRTLRLVNKERTGDDCSYKDKGYLVWADLGVVP
ncbi:NPCBM/NEW2 domain-containing protein [Lentzea sp. HUAS TT2]|uniref:NPCBM/NEW2 domain-containing protein n=1 Tax=Lentzea sp. HUAS TT2 TaxID=3447454 RepID=UPI003F72BA38